MHLLGHHHVPPPGKANSLVEEDGWEHTVRSNDVQLLLRKEGDGWDAGVGDIPGHVAGCWIGDVVDGGEHAGGLGDERVAGSDSFGVLKDTALIVSFIVMRR